MIANELRTPGDWCESEVSDINFGDRMLTERFITAAERLLMNPEALLNQDCIGWAETKAAYRLFDNERVTPEAILKALPSGRSISSCIFGVLVQNVVTTTSTKLFRLKKRKATAGF